MEIKSAFTLGEVILSIMLLGLMIGAIFRYVDTQSLSKRQQVSIADENTRATMSQEGVLLGGPFRPHYSWDGKDYDQGIHAGFPLIQFSQTPGVMGGIWQQDSPTGIHPREDRLGVYLLPETEEIAEGRKKLLPPVAHYSGEIQPHWFPLVRLLSEPDENPAGTYYRYQQGGLSVDENSSIFDFGLEWTPVSIPLLLTVRAYHSDPYYLPSDLLQVHFSAAPPEVSWSREDGSHSTQLKTSEIYELQNLIVLMHDSELEGFWEIFYTLDGSSPLTEGILYHTPLLPEGLPGDEIILRAVAKSVNNHFPSGRELQVVFQIHDPVLTIEKWVIGENPLLNGEGSGENLLNYEAGSAPFSYGEEVELIATPAYGYRVEWEGTDTQEGNRARILMDRDRTVRVFFRLGLVVGIYDEYDHLRQVERFRYREKGAEDWSEWMESPQIFTEIEEGTYLEFELEDLIEEGIFRSLYPVNHYLYDQALDLSMVALYSKEPQPRAFFQVGTHQWNVPEDAPGRLFVELIGGGASGAPGWISQGGYWNGVDGILKSFEIRLEAGGGGGSGELLRGVLSVPPDRQVEISVGKGGIPSNEYELRYTGSGYQYFDGSSYLHKNGAMTVRETTVESYPKVGKGGSSLISNRMDSLIARGGEVAVNPHKGHGNIVAYVTGGHGGFGGGGGQILWGGEVIGGMFPENDSRHSSGGISWSADFNFYPFSILEFSDAGLSGMNLWWMSNVLILPEGAGGSGSEYAWNPFASKRVFTGGVARKGYRFPLDWYINRIPMPEVRDGIYRESPAEGYRGKESVSKQKDITGLLDFVSGGGGGGGVKIRQSLPAELSLYGDTEVHSPAERGWYAATWANVYGSGGFTGVYYTAGSPGMGFGAGGGGASSPWSHPRTWEESGLLGHYTNTKPGNASLNLFKDLPSRGSFADDAAGIKLPSTAQPNARGMMGPPGGKGANGLVVIYY